jgi:hypothetical protein
MSAVHAGQIGRLDDAPPEDKEAEVRRLMEKMLEMSRVHDEVSAAVADVDLIGGEKERDAAFRYAESIRGLSFTDTTVEGWRERVEKEYEEARVELVDAAREALRKVKRH